MKEPKATYRVEIEYGADMIREGRKLGPEEDFIFENRKERPKKLEKKIKHIIYYELPEDMEKMFDVEVRIKDLQIYYGSMIILFTAILTGYNLIANYKNFYDSVHLIKRQCKRRFNSMIARDYNGMYDVSIDIEYSSISEPEESRYIFGSFPPNFFYYLLILYLASLMIIALLVYSVLINPCFI